MDPAAKVAPTPDGSTADGGAYEDALGVLDSPQTAEPSTGAVKTLLASLSSESGSRALVQRLKNNPAAFIEGLRVAKDENGTLLCAVISRIAPEKQKDVSKTVLKCLVTAFKVSPNREWYLAVYYSVMETFEISVPDHLDILLGHLGPLADSAADHTTSMILVIAIKNLKMAPQATTETVTNYIELLLDEEPSRVLHSSFLNLMCVLESLYPLAPVPIATLYMGDKCRSLILLRFSALLAAKLNDSVYSESICEVLKLISASCIDEQLRNFNVQHFGDALKTGTTLGTGAHDAVGLLCTLCVVKMWNSFPKDSEARTEKFTRNLVDNLAGALRHNTTHTETVIEALAYISLEKSSKETLRSDVDSVSILIKTLKEAAPQSTLVFGILTTIANLAKIQPDSADDRRRTAAFLKSYADPSSLKMDDQEKVLTFSKSLLEDHKIIEVFSRLKMTQSVQDSGSILNQIIGILHSIASNKEKKVRQEMVAQGALTILLNYLVSFSKADQKTRPLTVDPATIETRILALRSLAKILVSVNPALAFKKYDISTCVPFLVELLGPDLSQYNGIKTNDDDAYLGELTNKDRYEALIALTNVLSVDDPRLKKLVGSRTFGHLDNFILDSDEPYVQRAAWELLSNIISEPSVLVHFFNTEKPANKKRLVLMINLLNAGDEKLQVAVAGLLANAVSAFQMVAQILVEQPEVWSQLRTNIKEILEEQTDNHDLVHRVLFVLLGVAEVTSAEKDNIIKSDRELKQALAVALRSNNQETRETVMEIIRSVGFGKSE